MTFKDLYKKFITMAKAKADDTVGEVKYPLGGVCPEGHVVTSSVKGAGYCDTCQKGDNHKGPAENRAAKEE